MLKLAGHMDPEDIHEYIAHGGYLALEKVLKTMTPSQVVDEIKNPACGVAAAAVFQPA